MPRFVLQLSGCFEFRISRLQGGIEQLAEPEIRIFQLRFGSGELRLLIRDRHLSAMHIQRSNDSGALPFFLGC